MKTKIRMRSALFISTEIKFFYIEEVFFFEQISIKVTYIHSNYLHAKCRSESLATSVGVF